MMAGPILIFVGFVVAWKEIPILGVVDGEVEIFLLMFVLI
jgi:hypothetical protein